MVQGFGCMKTCPSAKLAAPLLPPPPPLFDKPGAAPAPGYKFSAFWDS